MEQGVSQVCLEDLIHQLEDLRRRVAQLETLVAHGVSPDAPSEISSPAVLRGPEPVAGEGVSGAAPLAGRALLGIAGAFLLRAFTEYGTVPPAAGAALGIVYAFVWLLRAGRAGRRAAAAVYAVTSSLILAPLLWESAVRFHALPDWISAAVLIVFAGAGLMVSWRGNIEIVAWVSTLASPAVAAVLLVATHDLAPFTVAILAVAAAIEGCACFDHWVKERWAAATLANLSVLLMTWMLTRAAGLPEGYVPIPAALASGVLVTLSAIYLASTIARTILRGLPITAFETAQCAVALVLSLGGAARMGFPMAGIGAFSLLFALACYAVSLRFLERRAGASRNLYTYLAFGVVLMLAGTWLLLPPLAIAVAWPVLGLACLRFGQSTGRRTLAWHGTVYLVLSTVITGLAAWCAARLLGAAAGWVAPRGEAWIPLAAAFAGYALAVARVPVAAHVWALAGNAAWVAAGLLSALLAGLFDLLGMSALESPAKTAALVILAIVAAEAGHRRAELPWIVYPSMILAGYKIVAVDLGKGQTFGLFLSLFIYGGALVLLPKLIARRAQA